MAPNNVAKFHWILIKTIGLIERLSFIMNFQTKDHNYWIYGSILTIIALKEAIKVPNNVVKFHEF